MHFISTFLLVFPFFFRSSFFLNPYSGSGAVTEGLLGQREGRKLTILTFNLEVSLGGEIVALSNRAGVATRVSGLGLLDDQAEGVLVGLKSKLGSFVAFLGGGEQSAMRVSSI